MIPDKNVDLGTGMRSTGKGNDMIYYMLVVLQKGLKNKINVCK